MEIPTKFTNFFIVFEEFCFRSEDKKRCLNNLSVWAETWKIKLWGKIDLCMHLCLACFVWIGVTTGRNRQFFKYCFASVFGKLWTLSCGAFYIIIIPYTKKKYRLIHLFRNGIMYTREHRFPWKMGILHFQAYTIPFSMIVSL